jgi:hypothetical protein
MSFVQRELDRIHLVLTSKPEPQRYSELYAVQQALAWALDPTDYKAPCDLIVPPTDTLEGLEGCPAENGPSEFSDNHALRVAGL